LLSHLFLDSTLSTFLSFVCANSWYLYHLTINNITLPSPQSTDVKRAKYIEMSKSMRITIVGALVLWVILTNIVFIFNLNTNSIFCDNIYFSNNSVVYLYFILVVLFVILVTAQGLFNQNISFSVEYVLFVIILTIVSYLLISSTNLFVTIFLLEFIALLIFGKMAVSRVLVKKSSIDSINSFNPTQYSYGLFNSLFFQFWANFVSSACLFFTLLNIHYVFGTSNFFIINFLFYLLNCSTYITNVFISVILIVLLTGFFIKLGLSPYQFFKIETYKGIPLYIIIVYTTIYLVTYIYIFLFLFLYQLNSLREFVGSYVLFILTVNLLYLVSLLFDTKNFKAFLSYSTLITLSNILVIILIL
jgi:NADH:ubiquinone oxidoreductase subunit 2 (subunit N)